MISQTLGPIFVVLSRTVRIQPMQVGCVLLQATLHVAIAPPSLHQEILKSHYSTKIVVRGPNMWPWLSGAHVTRGAACLLARRHMLVAFVFSSVHNCTIRLKLYST
jgi:hypothetical protein